MLTECSIAVAEDIAVEEVAHWTIRRHHRYSQLLGIPTCCRWVYGIKKRIRIELEAQLP